jgi:hypothetical protein
MLVGNTVKLRLTKRSLFDPHSQKREATFMIKTLVINLGTLLLVLLVFNTMAHADTFKVLITDTATGAQTVVTDNVAYPLPSLNLYGDTNSALGTIQFSGNTGNFFVTLVATASTATGAGVLNLSANVQYQATGPDKILIAVEDNGYTAVSSTASLVDTVGGYISSSNTVTPTGDLAPTATSISLQSWIDATGAVPAFGNSAHCIAGCTGSTAIPGTAADTTGISFTTTGFSGSSSTALNDLSTSVPYSITSEATVNFTGGGAADFTLTASDPVPEPTSLMLLGSALHAGGILRKTKKL